MKRSLAMALMALGISGTASAQDDVTVVLGNLPNTVTVLADGLANVADVYNTTGSLESASAAVWNSNEEGLYPETITSLIQGAPTLGALTQLRGQLVSPLPGLSNRVAMVLDDPSVESIEANLLSADDVNTIIGRNLPEMPDRVYNGTLAIPSFPAAGKRSHVGQQVTRILAGQGQPLDTGSTVAGGFSPLDALWTETFRDTALGESRANGVDINVNATRALRDKLFIAYAGADLYSVHDDIEAELEPLLEEHVHPIAAQQLFGQTTLAQAEENLEFEPTLDFLGYYGLVGAAGFEYVAPPCTNPFGC